nr:retrovirus-related Pol polyprotein from transposon TNT 1-94 [Tanacetum cinerariifolium]
MLAKIRKQAHATHKAKNIVSMTRRLEHLHMVLFGPSAVRSSGGNRYTLVIIDDYSRKVEESLNVTFNETPPPSKTSPLVDDDLDEEEAIKVIEKKNLKNDIVDETLEIDEIVNIKESKNHPLENVIENLNQRTLRSQAQNQRLWYPKGIDIETVVYANSDHVGDYVDRKSTSDICTFVGCCLTSWFSKKQTALVISTTEAEYVSAGKACQVTRTKNKKTIVVDTNEILTRKIQPHIKPWVDIIRENVICLGGHKDHVSACLCHMLYCIETSTRYNLAFFILKRMEKTQSKPTERLPYGMLLTRLFKHVVFVFPELAIDRYISHDRVMHPFAPQYERKTRSNCGKKRPHELNASSSSTSLNHPSSSHPLDDTLDENDDESFHSNSSSSSQNISSSPNVASRVRQNPPHESHNLNSYLSETINLQLNNECSPERVKVNWTSSQEHDGWKTKVNMLA